MLSVTYSGFNHHNICERPEVKSSLFVRGHVFCDSHTPFSGCPDRIYRNLNFITIGNTVEICAMNAVEVFVALCSWSRVTIAMKIHSQTDTPAKNETVMPPCTEKLIISFRVSLTLYRDTELNITCMT